jgi:hypothetical protein
VCFTKAPKKEWHGTVPLLPPLNSASQIKSSKPIALIWNLFIAPHVAPELGPATVLGRTIFFTAEDEKSDV